MGAIRDLTEKKKLEQQLLQEQEQKHKAVSQAGIAAQEAERSNISRELHDNVNQLLMSAKLFMNSAKTDPGKADEHIEKAMTYQIDGSRRDQEAFKNIKYFACKSYWS